MTFQTHRSLLDVRGLRPVLVAGIAARPPVVTDHAGCAIETGPAVAGNSGNTVRELRLGRPTEWVAWFADDAAETAARLWLGYRIEEGESFCGRATVRQRDKLKLILPFALDGTPRIRVDAVFFTECGDVLARAGAPAATLPSHDDEVPQRPFIKIDVPERATAFEATTTFERGGVVSELPHVLTSYFAAEQTFRCRRFQTPVLHIDVCGPEGVLGRNVRIRYFRGESPIHEEVLGFGLPDAEGWALRRGSIALKSNAASEAIVLPVPFGASRGEVQVSVNRKARFRQAPLVTMRPSLVQASARPEVESRPHPDVIVYTTASSYRPGVLQLRSHFMARLFAERGLETWYVPLAGEVGEPVPMPRLRQFPRRDFETLVQVAMRAPRPGIFVCSSLCDSHMVMMLEGLKRRGWLVVYEVRDDMEAMRRAGFSGWYIPEFERFLCVRSDLIICVSQPLRQRVIALGADERRVIVIPNGISADELEDAEAAWHPEILARRTRVGYFGHMFPGRFDTEAVRRAALALPDVLFEMVGPGLYDAEKLRLPNVTLHDQVEPAMFFELARNWAVGLLPFRNNQLTYALDPIKHYQYLAAGLRVVSTDVAALRGRPMTRVCTTSGEFVSAVAAELERPVTAADRDAALTFLKGATWGQRFEVAFSAIRTARTASSTS